MHSQLDLVSKAKTSIEKQVKNLEEQADDNAQRCSELEAQISELSGVKVRLQNDNSDLSSQLEEVELQLLSLQVSTTNLHQLVCAVRKLNKP